MNKVTKESVVIQLKGRGLKMTPQRLAIINVLMETRDLHPDARFVRREAKKRKKGLSLSTTYATLNELSHLSIIEVLPFDGMENRYEGNLEEHVNLICEQCGKTIDYTVHPIVGQRNVAKTTGFSVTDARLDYYRLCRECRRGVLCLTIVVAHIEL